MRRLSGIWSRRRLRLVLVTVLALLFFQGRLEPRPASVARTEAEFQSPYGDVGNGIWSDGKTLAHVSDDGRYVVFSGHRGPKTAGRTTLFRWDMRTGREATPAVWFDPASDRVLYGNTWRNAGAVHGLAHPAGERWLIDEHRLRSVVGRCRELASDPNARAGSTVQLSIDGQCLIYDVRERGPDDAGGERSQVVIEDAATGHRIAVLPRAADNTIVAPGARTAITGKYDYLGVEGGAQLWIWEPVDLGRLVGRRTARRVNTFSPDGPVFDYRSTILGRPLGVSWWDDDRPSSERPTGEG